jgi:hypothetical protein
LGITASGVLKLSAEKLSAEVVSVSGLSEEEFSIEALSVGVASVGVASLDPNDTRSTITTPDMPIAAGGFEERPHQTSPSPITCTIKAAKT